MKASSWLLHLFILMHSFPGELFGLHALSNDSVVYVWDFKSDTEETLEIAAWLTNDFETELIKSNQYIVLERRNYHRIISHQKMEDKISDIQEISDSSRESLQSKQAQVVVFGTVTDDVQSGVYEVVVAFQKFDGTILRKASILIGRGLIRDNQTRKSKMHELLRDLHKNEVDASKKLQYEWISSILNAFIVQAKNVRKGFADLADIAVIDQNYCDELSEVILAYNGVFEDLNQNRPKYRLDFSTNWESTRVNRLDQIFNDLLTGIHQKYMLTLDRVRLDIVNDKGLKNKKKRDRFQRDVNSTTNGLQAEITRCEFEISSFLNELEAQLRN